MTKTRSARGERGSAMLVTMLVVVALIAGAGVLAGLQMSSNRSTDLTRSGMSALYCAEAGLSAARPFVESNYAEWATALGESNGAEPTNQPAFLSSNIPMNTAGYDLDGAGTTQDFKVWIEDNHDEAGPSDPAIDVDLRVFIVSRCLAFPDTPKEVRELIEFNGVTRCYPWQMGGCGGTNNANDAP